MRYAVIADIHANLEALRAVLGKIADVGADRTVCLGDIVGYNPNPNECLEIVRAEGITSVLGNHDAVACGLEEPDRFNPLARQAVLWTRQQLTAENSRYLKELPRELRIDDIFICHGSLHDTDRYIVSIDDVSDNLALLEAVPGKPVVCFFGHTHIRAAYSARGRVIALELADRVLLSSEKRYLMNPGGVGQPRDGDPRAAFLIYDQQERTAVFHRVEYDIAACQDKIIRAGLPARLAERLSIGM